MPFLSLSLSLSLSSTRSHSCTQKPALFRDLLNFVFVVMKHIGSKWTAESLYSDKVVVVIDL